MTYVYILSDYDEHGAEDVVATLDRHRLLDLVRSGDFNVDSNAKAEAFVRLNAALLLPDADLAKRDGINLTSGWGGIQLHVVELQ